MLNIRNAKAGLAIVANAKDGIYMRSNNVMNQLGNDWIDAYIAWNYQFVST